MSSEPRVLIVDDRKEARSLIAGELRDAGFQVTQAEDGSEGWRCFRRSEPALVITDLRMPRADGIDLLGRIRSVSNVPVIVLTAFGDVPTAVSAMKRGAQEFFNFPDDLDRLIERARELTGVDEGSDYDLQGDVAGSSIPMRSVRQRIRALAPLRVPVLVCGERGSGRDCVVRAIHASSDRAAAPLIKIEADTRRIPPIPEAGAVFYLDEVTRLTPSDQAHWRSIVESGERAAGQRVLRILASTSEDLSRCAREGVLDPYLASSLRRFTILLPSLASRPEDVPTLVRLLAHRVGLEMGRASVRFDRSALSLLRKHDWPGNVRQLAAVVEKLVAFSVGGSITTQRVREVLRESPDSVSMLRLRRHQEQREELVELLEKCGGNYAEVGRRLGMSRGAVIYRAQKHGLAPKPR